MEEPSGISLPYSSLANDGPQKENCDNKPARRKNCVTKPPHSPGGQGLAAVEKHSMRRSEVAEWKTASPNPPRAVAAVEKHSSTVSRHCLVAPSV